jgi:hypothetical protein
MTPLGFVLALIFSLLIFCLPRKMATASLIAGICYLTEGLPLDVAGFHFTGIRFILLAGFIRVMARGELNQVRFNTIDRSLFIFALAILIISTLRVGTSTELVYQTGTLYNVFLAYFVFRSLLKEEHHYRDVLAIVAFVIIPFALLMFFESLTNRNVFAVFGGVSDPDMMREGQIRAQGAFRSPITAGAFGATFAMLYASILFARPRTRWALVGLIASVLIVFCSHSSGPLLGLALGLASLACWFVRRHTSKIRWAIVAALVGLNMVMKVPVWFLIGRVSDIVGGGGYHRAYLIDQFVRHFGSWWLAGTSNTSDWMPTQLEAGGADLTNKFVADGVSGGLIGLVLSVALVVACFKWIGIALKAHRGQPATEKLVWGIGATLVGTIAIFFSVTYFDQMYVLWYFLVACIAALNIAKRRLAVVTARRPPAANSRFPAGLSSVP